MYSLCFEIVLSSSVFPNMTRSSCKGAWKAPDVCAAAGCALSVHHYVISDPGLNINPWM